jgi:uncharacterized membrane protein (UPF0127 family)
MQKAKIVKTVLARKSTSLDHQTVKRLKGMALICLLLASVLIVGFSLKGLTSHKQTCRQTYRSDGQLVIGDTSFAFEKASSDEQRIRGLSGRICISSGQAMLFEFEQDGSQAIWMKDMLFPIDIVWLDAQKRVVFVVRDADPKSYPQIFQSTTPARYVLELPEQVASSKDLETGSVVNW